MRNSESNPDIATAIANLVSAANRCAEESRGREAGHPRESWPVENFHAYSLIDHSIAAWFLDGGGEAWRIDGHISYLKWLARTMMLYGLGRLRKFHVPHRPDLNDPTQTSISFLPTSHPAPEERVQLIVRAWNCWLKAKEKLKSFRFEQEALSRWYEPMALCANS